MPPKSSKNTKTTRKTKNSDETDDDATSVYTLGTDHDDTITDIDPIESDVKYKIHSNNSVQLQELQSFFNDPKMINASHDPTTNIVNRLEGKCYNVPEKKLPTMFKALEACRRAKINVMFNEKQNDPSGIMLDFDIYQDTEADQITDEIFFMLCQKILELLTKLINFKDAKKETIYIGITRRPKITFKDEDEVYKDGFHMLIPGIKVNRGTKVLLINKLLDNEIIEQIFADVEPASMKAKDKNGRRTNVDYSRRDFLDTNSAHVPPFFVGSSTKKGSAPYRLTHIYEATVNFESKSIMLIRNESLMKTKSFNVCHEFSINYECPGGTIKKVPYEVADKYASEVAELSKQNKQVEELNRNFGMLNMNSVYDAQVQEIKDLLDTLSLKRADDYGSWRDVLFALANTSISYRDLAEYFSRKSSKYNQVSFEKMWLEATKGPNRNRKAITLGTLHYWAKIDNPERYNQIRKQGVKSILEKMVYESYKDGMLSHADIAELIHKLLKHKFITDQPPGERGMVWFEFIMDEDPHQDGELYKWRRWKSAHPISMMRYISETLPNLFDLVLKNVKKNYEESSGELSKYLKKVLDNFKGTMRKLGDRAFKKNVILEAEDKFYQCGFATLLDVNPVIRGVQNGVLKLAWGGQPPQLIQGYHSHKISKYTDVPYIAFDPRDPITKKILTTLRGMFPNNETDTFEFTMYFLASTLDGNPKESMIMLMVGQGSNGKSFLVELHKSAIGEIYGVKMPLSFLTAKSSSPDGATPATMMLKDATFAYYSESEKHEVLNAARMKEITGQETLAGRKLHQDMINFKPRCHHLVTSNNDFDIHSHDHGTWRRVIYNPLKIRFVDTANERLDKNNPLQREADVSITDSWTQDPEVRGRYLGFMVWMHFWLYQRYGGKVKRVPHPHIDFETEKYKLRQDTITAFLSQRLVKLADPLEQKPMVDEIQKYAKWYTSTQGGAIVAKGITEMFKNSSIGKYIAVTSRGTYMTGHRFLDHGEQPEEGEEYAMKDVYDLEMAPGNAGIQPETPDEYHARVCIEFDKYKHLFSTEAKFDVDSTIPVSMMADESVADLVRATGQNNDNNRISERRDNVELGGRILPSGIQLKPLAEPTINQLTDEYYVVHMAEYLKPDDDDDETIILDDANVKSE